MPMVMWLFQKKNIGASKYITYQDFFPLIQYLNLNLFYNTMDKFHLISENLDWENFDILKNS